MPLRSSVTSAACRAAIAGTDVAFYHIETNGAFTRQFANRNITSFGIHEMQTYAATRTSGGPPVCRPHALDSRLLIGLPEEQHRVLGNHQPV